MSFGDSRCAGVLSQGFRIGFILIQILGSVNSIFSVILKGGGGGGGGSEGVFNKNLCSERLLR